MCWLLLSRDMHKRCKNPSECPARHPCRRNEARRDVHPEPRVRASGTATAAIRCAQAPGLRIFVWVEELV